MKPVGSLKFFKNPKPEVSWLWRFSKPQNQRFIKYKSYPVKITSYFAAPSRPTIRTSETKAQHSILLLETCSADVDNHQQMISGQRKQLRIKFQFTQSSSTSSHYTSQNKGSKHGTLLVDLGNLPEDWRVKWLGEQDSPAHLFSELFQDYQLPGAPVLSQPSSQFEKT